MSSKSIAIVAVSIAVVAAAVAAIVVSTKRADAAKAYAEAEAARADAAAAEAKSDRAKADAETARRKAAEANSQAERDKLEAAKLANETAQAEAKAAEDSKAAAADIAAAEREKAEGLRAIRETAKLTNETARIAQLQAKEAAAAERAKAEAEASKLAAERQKAEKILAEAKVLELRKIDYETLERNLLEWKLDLEERERAIRPEKTISDLSWAGGMDDTVVDAQGNLTKQVKVPYDPEKDMSLSSETRKLIRVERQVRAAHDTRAADMRSAVVASIEKLYVAALREGRSIDAEFYRKNILSMYPDWKFSGAGVEKTRKHPIDK